ncbi:MAG: SpoIIE family protein phosphatase [Candidatus Ozemobacteraceae bacterium]
MKQQAFPLRNEREDFEKKTIFEMQNLLESLEQPAFSVRLNGDLVFINQTMLQLLRRSSENLVGKPWTSLLNSNDCQTAELFFQEKVSHPSRKETFTFLTNEGTGKFLKISFTQLIIGGEYFVLGIGRDPAMDHPFLSFFQRRFEIEALVCKISAEFLAITSENIEEIITESLEKIGRFVQASHSYLLLYSEDNTTVEKVFEWSNTESYSRKGRISGISLSVVQNTRDNNSKFGNSSPSCLVYPGISPQELDYLKSRNIHAFLGLPVKAKGQAIGYLGIDASEENRTWVDEDMSLLKLTAELFANSLLRFRAEKKCQTTDARYRALIRNFPGGMVLLFDRESRFLLADGEDIRSLACFKKRLEGRTIEEIFPAEKYSSLQEILRETFCGKSCTTEIEFHGEWYEIRAVPVPSSLGEIHLGMIVALRVSEQKRMAEELRQIRFREENTAIEIQKTLLASKTPHGMEKADFGLLSCPSQLVDGDFTDFILLNDHIIDVIIGDVMGKGVPAALIGAATKEAILRVMTRLVGGCHGLLPTIEQIVTAVQKDIGYRLTQLSVFVTFVYCRIDLTARKITVINAGHPPVLQLSAATQKIAVFPSVAAPLGLMNDKAMLQQSADFSWNDRLLVFSDGIPDTRNKEGKFFGYERIHKLLIETRKMLPQDATEKIFCEVQKYADDPLLHDDFTCLLIDLHGGEKNQHSKN